VGHLVSAKGYAERRACGLIGLHRSVMRYVPCQADDSSVRQRLRDLAGQYRRYGYLRLHVLLQNEGLVINRKRTYRLYREESRGMHRRCRKRLPSARRVPTTPAERVNQLVDGLCLR
jgi:putative transposase